MCRTELNGQSWTERKDAQLRNEDCLSEKEKEEKCGSDIEVELGVEERATLRFRTRDRIGIEI